MRGVAGFPVWLALVAALALAVAPFREAGSEG